MFHFLSDPSGAVTADQVSQTFLVRCPICNFDYNHPGVPECLDSSDAYLADWSGRGDLIILPFRCEQGHRWELCIGFAKGNSLMFGRSSPKEEGPNES
jgi:hypothetical protein